MLFAKLLKVIKRTPAHSEYENEKEALLLRAYGKDTDILVDREREATIHAQLARIGLAAPLLARFQNGLLYRFIPGPICTAEDFINEAIWRAVAARLGE